MNAHDSWRCRRCGVSIGWLGHFMRGLLGRRLYAWLIGCESSPCGGIKCSSEFPNGSFDAAAVSSVKTGEPQP